MAISIIGVMNLILAFVVGLALGSVLSWLWGRAQLAEVKTAYDATSERLDQVEQSHTRTLQENGQLKVELARLQEEIRSSTEKLQWIDQAETKMRDAFQSLAADTLYRNSTTFLGQASQSVEDKLQQVVGPLKDNLTKLDNHVRALEQRREGAYRELQEQLRQLGRTHSDLQTTTVTLAQALKSPTVRGRWGEMQLRRVVEMAGLVENVHFKTQAAGDGGRPDMIVFLPNRGILPVDSKVPLDRYLEAVEAADEQIRKVKLADHASAMRSRVRELSQKKYWEQFDQTPDFVAMFVPNDSCLGAAFESDPGLLEYAVEQCVLITTPVTLLALLKAVSYGWQQHQMTENARQIADQGQELYRRLDTFAGHLAELGKNLNKTIESYNDAVGSWEGRLRPWARHFQKMGIATSEILSPSAIETKPRLPSAVETDPQAEEQDS